MQSAKKELSKKLKWFYMIWFFLSVGTLSKFIAIYTLQYQVGNFKDPTPLIIMFPLLILTVWGVVKSNRNIVIFSATLMALFGVYQLFNGLHHLLYGSGGGAALFMWLYFTVPSFIFLGLFIKHFQLFNLNKPPNN